MSDAKIQGCCHKCCVHPTIKINSPRRLMCVHNLGCRKHFTLDYNKQFPTTHCASSKSMGVVRNAMYARLQQLIPHSALCFFRIQRDCRRLFACSTTSTNSLWGTIEDVLHIRIQHSNIPCQRGGVVKPGDVQLDPSFFL